MGINPMPLASTLPIVQAGARVYIVGYSGGRDLAFSFQDNELLVTRGRPAAIRRSKAYLASIIVLLPNPVVREARCLMLGNGKPLRCITRA
jgi:hypothetical protein